MMGGISAAGGMPDFSRIQQMRQQAFSKADGDASGGLDVDEFKSLVESGPMARMGSTPDAAKAFGKLDGDGDGQLTQTELDDGMQKMLKQMSTQMFASFSGAKSASTEKTDTMRQQLDALLAALEEGSGKDAGIDLLA